MTIILLYFIRPHRIHAVHRCGLLLQVSHIAWSVCRSVGHTEVLYENGWTNRDAVWGTESCGSNEPCVRFPTGRGNYGGCPDHWRAVDASAAVYAAKWIIQSSISTAAADCNAPDWSMSHRIVPCKKIRPSMLFDKILWPPALINITIKTIQCLVARYWLKIAVWTYPTCICRPPLGVTPLEFRRYFWRQKTESLGYRTALYAWFYI